jgi:hypothetical protein
VRSAAAREQVPLRVELRTRVASEPLTPHGLAGRQRALRWGPGLGTGRTGHHVSLRPAEEYGREFPGSPRGKSGRPHQRQA